MEKSETGIKKEADAIKLAEPQLEVISGGIVVKSIRCKKCGSLNLYCAKKCSHCGQPLS